MLMKIGLFLEILLGMILLQSAPVWCMDTRPVTAGVYAPTLPMSIQDLACQEQKAHMPVDLQLEHMRMQASDGLKGMS